MQTSCKNKSYSKALKNHTAAFTLAEVLITLGVIGVVAAMTLPSVIQNHKNKVVETRLAKFYSAINQAIQLAEAQYGDKKYWYQDTQTIYYDEDGNAIKGASEIEKWWNKYIAPNMHTVQVKYNQYGSPVFYFADGTALAPNAFDSMRDWVFYTGDPDKCRRIYKTEANTRGKCSFIFLYMPIPANSDVKENDPRFKYHLNRGFEPYKYNWDGKTENLYNDSDYGCNIAGTGAYCGALIQNNGWKIPKDYPYHVSY